MTIVAGVTGADLDTDIGLDVVYSGAPSLSPVALPPSLLREYASCPTSIPCSVGSVLLGERSTLAQDDRLLDGELQHARVEDACREGT